MVSPPVHRALKLALAQIASRHWRQRHLMAGNSDRNAPMTHVAPRAPSSSRLRRRNQRTKRRQDGTASTPPTALDLRQWRAGATLWRNYGKSRRLAPGSPLIMYRENADIRPSSVPPTTGKTGKMAKVIGTILRPLRRRGRSATPHNPRSRAPTLPCSRPCGSQHAWR